METIKLRSSFIREATYCKDRQRLSIRIGDYVYSYYGVTLQKVSRFKKATSKGSYYSRKIKGMYKVIRRKAK